MNEPIIISIVAPVYGVERFIGRFAESVLSQSYPHIQFVFVDDGTKDSSIDILNELIDSRFFHLRERVVIVHKQNAGLPAARQTGMEYVTGDYVWHVDSDDWIAEDAVEKLVSRIMETGSDVIYFGYMKEYADRSKPKPEKEYTTDQKQTYVRNMYTHKAYGSVCNKCIRRSLYDKPLVKFAPYAYAEDTYLTTQLVGYASSISHLDECLYHYRKDNPHAITRQNMKKRHREYALNFLDLYERYRDVPAESNPVHVILDDILLKAGWYSIIYRLGLFKSHPYLAEAILKAKLRTGSEVWIPAQLLVKLIALLNN